MWNETTNDCGLKPISQSPVLGEILNAVKEVSSTLDNIEENAGDLSEKQNFT
jgi:hypothetical protein